MKFQAFFWMKILLVMTVLTTLALAYDVRRLSREHGALSQRLEKVESQSLSAGEHHHKERSDDASR